MPPLCFAYYCSGHGYGHATRVSAFASHLLSLSTPDRPTVHIVSSAPKHVFSDSIALGALYRYAEVDAVIVQPLAYRVDRQKSVEALKSFFSRKQSILNAELKWLIDIRADTVLSDAAFLGCLAAKAASIPSVLITNFTFDSVYSYLSTTLRQVDLELPAQADRLSPNASVDSFFGLVPDIPVAPEELDPLVAEIYEGYRCADLLFLLPGYIPIPSFSSSPRLPSPDWVDTLSNRFYPNVIDRLLHAPLSFDVPPSIVCPINSDLSRAVISAPLLVRSPTSTPSVYMPEGRSKFLSSIGIPEGLHDPARTKILIVSFGGQIFRAPSRSVSRSASRRSSPIPSHYKPNGIINDENIPDIQISPISSRTNSDSDYSATTTPLERQPPRRLATQSHIYIPGAPPASKPSPPPFPSLDTALHVPELTTIPPTPYDTADASEYLTVSPVEETQDDVYEPRLLPDESWIAIVCGTSKEQWSESDPTSTGLPEGFFVAPRDVYMPDLTAAGDVLLGKLGYGTVAECVDSCTPFVYVSRPLFIEEHGLRLLLDQEGVGVELSRQSYEAGEWAIAVEEAWIRGKESKAQQRRDRSIGKGVDARKQEGLDMARKLIAWTHQMRGYDISNSSVYTVGGLIPLDT